MESQDATRAEAELILAALAGDDARLREDQWVAIEALVCHHIQAGVLVEVHCVDQAH